MALQYKNSTVNVALAPKPVHPRAVRTHGLFGIPFVRQHMVVDERWTPSSLTEEFKGMADLLAKRLVFKKLEGSAGRKSFIKDYRSLRFQCRDGRHKLQMALYGENTKHIRNFLINHKDMQRLYQKMPLHLVVDNINQRTFVLRKERDRLRYRLNLLKAKYHDKLLERAVLENRIKYENEFVLEEEIKSRQFRKKIENSNVRLKAIKTINGTYRRIIQILRHDAIFYEPMLRSLNQDIEDQAQFIKHILYLGMPAIAKFKELSEEYRLMEDKARKNAQAKLQWVANYKKSEEKRLTANADVNKPKSFDVEEQLRRYVRETTSMLDLKNELEKIEDTIKEVKFATLCSQAREIYPRMKSQIDNNEKLHKMIENDILGHQAVEIKKKRAEVLEGVLINNLSDEEVKRLDRIKELNDSISKEDENEAKTVSYIKNRADAYVLLRYSLWNLNDILRHVDRSPKIGKLSYPNSYLKLPLLKFEMLPMRAYPPEIYEENLDALMSLLKRKVNRLMRAYSKEVSKEDIQKHNDEYHHMFLETTEMEEIGGEAEEKKISDDEEDLDLKTMQNVPNRKMIKAQSAKIVEELSKKDE